MDVRIEWTGTHQNAVLQLVKENKKGLEESNLFFFFVLSELSY